jgi:hypothetical protein
LVLDVTAQSFTVWRAQSFLREETLNDLLGAASSFLNWRERQQLIIAKPANGEGIHRRVAPAFAVGNGRFVLSQLSETRLTS